MIQGGSTDSTSRSEGGLPVEKLAEVLIFITSYHHHVFIQRNMQLLCLVFSMRTSHFSRLIQVFKLIVSTTRNGLHCKN